MKKSWWPRKIRKRKVNKGILDNPLVTPHSLNSFNIIIYFISFYLVCRIYISKFILSFTKRIPLRYNLLCKSLRANGFYRFPYTRSYHTPQTPAHPELVEGRYDYRYRYKKFYKIINPVARRIPKPPQSGVCMRICAKKDPRNLVQGSVRVLHQTLTKKRINKLLNVKSVYQEKENIRIIKLKNIIYNNTFCVLLSAQDNKKRY